MLKEIWQILDLLPEEQHVFKVAIRIFTLVRCDDCFNTSTLLCGIRKRLNCAHNMISLSPVNDRIQIEGFIPWDIVFGLALLGYMQRLPTIFSWCRVVGILLRPEK